MENHRYLGKTSDAWKAVGVCVAAITSLAVVLIVLYTLFPERPGILAAVGIPLALLLVLPTLNAIEKTRRFDLASFLARPGFAIEAKLLPKLHCGKCDLALGPASRELCISRRRGISAYDVEYHEIDEVEVEVDVTYRKALSLQKEPTSSRDKAVGFGVGAALGAGGIAGMIASSQRHKTCSTMIVGKVVVRVLRRDCGKDLCEVVAYDNFGQCDVSDETVTNGRHSRDNAESFRKAFLEARANEPPKSPLANETA